MEHFEKSIIPVIESVYPSFTPLERTVADFFIHNTDESDLSARHVSELLYVSEASLSRFAKKCGYTGYREFVYRYQEGLNATLPGTDDHISVTPENIASPEYPRPCVHILQVLSIPSVQ